MMASSVFPHRQPLPPTSPARLWVLTVLRGVSVICARPSPTRTAWPPLRAPKATAAGLGKRGGEGWTCLDEADVVGLFAEALTADVEAVLADQTGSVRADAAARHPASVPWTLFQARNRRSTREVSLTIGASPCRTVRQLLASAQPRRRKFSVPGDRGGRTVRGREYHTDSWAILTVRSVEKGRCSVLLRKRRRDGVVVDGRG